MSSPTELNRTSQIGNGHPGAAKAAPVTSKAVLSLRQPTREDGAQIHALIKACPPLDVNSVYAYLVLCEHFHATCVVATDDSGDVLGFVSAYVPPGREDVLFVWQVAVHEDARGQRLAKRMLDDILERPALNAVRFVETTVGPDNAASRATFQRLAAGGLANLVESALFPPDLFGEGEHDDERLLRIGPLKH